MDLVDVCIDEIALEGLDGKLNLCSSLEIR